MFKISDDICWVGYIDWNLRNFHGYSTPSGSTYNAYLILDEKPTLIDTVKDYGFEDMLSKINSPKPTYTAQGKSTEKNSNIAVDRRA